ncbi:MAG: DNA polymerase III subunit epsilon, partial [Proteobacteria bacterium]|nr:DNA polymerase III subunit epsilon [Pseudomonadota bacterium]
YRDPGRAMPSDAFAIHGLSNDFLSRQKRFAEIADDFVAFIGDSPVVAHNAAFDIGFINAEFALAKRPAFKPSKVIDTVRLARRKFPGAQASLDALCRRFGINLSERAKHGALLDAELLAEVYLELVGGRQPGLTLSAKSGVQVEADVEKAGKVWPPRPHTPSAEELAAHKVFVATLRNPIWRP